MKHGALLTQLLTKVASLFNLNSPMTKWSRWQEWRQFWKEIILYPFTKSFRQMTKLEKNHD